jgi:hypothetical protein
MVRSPVFYVGDKKDFCTIGRVKKIADAAFMVRYLFAFCAVGIHFPQLNATTFGGKKGDACAVFLPIWQHIHFLWNVLFGARC